MDAIVVAGAFGVIGFAAELYLVEAATRSRRSTCERFRRDLLTELAKRTLPASWAQVVRLGDAGEARGYPYGLGLALVTSLLAVAAYAAASISFEVLSILLVATTLLGLADAVAFARAVPESYCRRGPATVLSYEQAKSRMRAARSVLLFLLAAEYFVLWFAL